MRDLAADRQTSRGGLLGCSCLTPSAELDVDFIDSIEVPVGL